LQAHDVLAQYEALAQVFALLEAAVVVAGAVAAEFVHCPACFNVVPLSQQYASGV